jgi:hypothetical protein
VLFKEVQEFQMKSSAFMESNIQQSHLLTSNNNSTTGNNGAINSNNNFLNNIIIPLNNNNDNEKQLQQQLQHQQQLTTIFNGLQAQYETFRQDIESIEDFFHESTELSSLVLDTCDEAGRGVNVMHNIIPVSVGGNFLRRSTWKKVTAWQYCTTNLNIHLLTSNIYGAEELKSEHDAMNRNVNNSDNNNNISLHCSPSVTLGFVLFLLFIHFYSKLFTKLLLFI